MKVWRLEGWRGFVISPVSRHFHRVTVFERRSHLGLPAEGRPGPSDDYYDDFDENGYYPPVSPVSMCQHDDDEYEEGVEYDDDEGFNGDDGDEHELWQWSFLSTGLVGLKRLDLSHNKVSEIHPEAFLHLRWSS